MSDLYINPAKVPAPEEYQDRNKDMTDWGGTHMEPAGPGGRTNNVNGNEKGILEVGLFRAMEGSQTAALGTEHRSHRQGIYGQNTD